MALKIPFILFCTFIAFGIDIYAQEPFHINYTTENGLPSNEVYCAYQDTTGYIWFGTDNGVSRYDGYTFENFGTKHGLERMEINKIIPDSQGMVWFSSFFGKVYSFIDNEFVPYKWNNILDKFKETISFIDLQGIDKNGNFYFSLQSVGVLIIDKLGNHTLLSPDCGFCLMSYKNEKSIFIVEQCAKRSNTNFVKENSAAISKGIRDMYNYDKDFKLISKTKIDEEPLSGNPKYFVWNDSIYLFSLYQRLNIMYHGQIKKSIKIPSHINVISRISNDLFLGLSGGNGLYKYNEWSITNLKLSEKWLQGTDVSFILKDHNNGHWITTINNGVFYITNDKIRVYKNYFGYEEKKFTAIFPEGQGDAVSISYEGNIIMFKNYKNDKTIKVKRAISSPDVFKQDNIIFLRSHFISGKGKVKFKSDWPTIFERKPKQSSFYGANRNFLHKKNKMSFDLFIDQSLNSDFIWDIFRPKDDSLWMATNGGLKMLSGNFVLPIVEELKNVKTISIDQLSSGNIVVGTKGKGIFILNPKKKILSNIDNSDGLSSDIIEYLWVDEMDNVWVATYNGLNKIQMDRNNKPFIRQFHMNHGLPSEEINMVRTSGDNIWLATGNGVVIFKEPETDTTTFVPEIKEIYLNGTKLASGLKKKFQHDENNIRIDFHNFDMTLGNTTFYKFRMNAKEVWNIQQSNSLSFLNLNPGIYKIEVQAKNKDGYWSDSLLIPVTILRPWWLSWYFIIFSMSVIGLWIYLYYTSRIKMIRSEQRLKNQMLTYEKQALLAQMNPHFIFNAFSAIQYYINTKATKKADDYLTDFSYLIRKILDNSGKKDILLSEEIKLLTLYTQLEARRFDNKFIVNIFVDDEIDTDVTRIPCMLIQPLVENAINHGLMHLTERKGKLQINFMDYNGSLRIVIEDNGVGMEKSKGTSLHKMFDSYGLKLLDDRISSYRNSGEYYITLTHEDLYDGSISAGTKFTMDIVKGKLEY